MKFLFAAGILCCPLLMTAPMLNAQNCPPPSPQTVVVVDDYHGTKVADPYRWLEDVDSPETKAWVEAENCVSFGFLERIPERTALTDRLTKLWNYAKYGVPFKEGGRYFFSKNDGLQNQSVLYTQRTLAGAPAVILDPNTLSEDGTVALSALAVSPDGRYLAYATSASGSDWQEFPACETSPPALISRTTNGTVSPCGPRATSSSPTSGGVGPNASRWTSCRPRGAGSP